MSKAHQNIPILPNWMPTGHWFPILLSQPLIATLLVTTSKSSAFGFSIQAVLLSRGIRVGFILYAKWRIKTQDSNVTRNLGEFQRSYYVFPGKSESPPLRFLVPSISKFRNRCKLKLEREEQTQMEVGGNLRAGSCKSHSYQEGRKTHRRERMWRSEEPKAMPFEIRPYRYQG